MPRRDNGWDDERPTPYAATMRSLRQADPAQITAVMQRAYDTITKGVADGIVKGVETVQTENRGWLIFVAVCLGVTAVATATTALALLARKE